MLSIKILLKRLRRGLITRISHFSKILSVDTDQHIDVTTVTQLNPCDAVTFQLKRDTLYSVVQVTSGESGCTLQEKGYLLLSSDPTGIYTYQQVSHSQPLPSAHNMLI